MFISSNSVPNAGSAFPGNIAPANYWRTTNIKDSMSTTPYILIVENPSCSNDSIATSLTNQGFQVETLYAAAPALQMTFDRQPKVILLDIDMPVINGQEFINLYRKVPGPSARIIGMASRSTAADAKLIMQFDAFLWKPI